MVFGESPFSETPSEVDEDPKQLGMPIGNINIIQHCKSWDYDNYGILPCLAFPSTLWLFNIAMEDHHV